MHNDLGKTSEGLWSRKPHWKGHLSVKSWMTLNELWNTFSGKSWEGHQHSFINNWISHLSYLRLSPVRTQSIECCLSLGCSVLSFTYFPLLPPVVILHITIL